MPTNKTINVTGVGRVYVNTDAAEVTLCAGLSDGTPVNARTHRVSADKRHAAEADRADLAGYSLDQVAPAVFVLRHEKIEWPALDPLASR